MQKPFRTINKYKQFVPKKENIVRKGHNKQQWPYGVSKLTIKKTKTKCARQIRPTANDPFVASNPSA